MDFQTTTGADNVVSYTLPSLTSESSPESSSQNADDFILFIERIETQVGVQDAIVQLQTQYPVNACFILFLLWYSTSCRGRLRKRDLTQLQSATQLWHQHIFLALSQLDKTLGRANSERALSLRPLLSEIMDLAKHVEQQLFLEAPITLKMLKRNEQQQLADACHNLVSYYKLLSLGLSQEDRQALTQLLQGVFSQLPLVSIEEELKHALSTAKITEASFSQLSLDDL